MRQLKVVFDVDDTLWPLTKTVADKIGVDYYAMNKYELVKDTSITDEQREKFMLLWSDPKTFSDIQWYKGVERINDLKADTYICSNNMTMEVLLTKRVQIRKVISLPDEKVILQLVGTDYTNKRLPDDMFILVEDSPINISKSKAVHNIVIKRPVNMTQEAIMQMMNSSGKLHFCDTLDQAIDLIEELLEKENMSV